MFPIPGTAALYSEFGGGDRARRGRSWSVRSIPPKGPSRSRTRERGPHACRPHAGTCRPGDRVGFGGGAGGASGRSLSPNCGVPVSSPLQRELEFGQQPPRCIAQVNAGDLFSPAHPIAQCVRVDLQVIRRPTDVAAATSPRPPTGAAIAARRRPLAAVQAGEYLVCPRGHPPTDWNCGNLDSSSRGGPASADDESRMLTTSRRLVPNWSSAGTSITSSLVRNASNTAPKIQVSVQEPANCASTVEISSGLPLFCTGAAVITSRWW